MEEIVVADLMRGFGLGFKQIVDGGYFMAHRLWDIWQECRAYDINELAIAGSTPHMSDEGRKDFYGMMQRRQKRRHPNELKRQMPPEVFEEFERKWNELEAKAKVADGRR